MKNSKRLKTVRGRSLALVLSAAMIFAGADSALVFAEGGSDTAGTDAGEELADVIEETDALSEEIFSGEETESEEAGSAAETAETEDAQEEGAEEESEEAEEKDGTETAQEPEISLFSIAGCTEMELDTEYTAVIDEEGGFAYYRFIPEYDGTYKFYTTGNKDTYAYLYDEDENLLQEDDDSGNGVNACIKAALEEGKTYYLAFCFLDSEKTGSFTVCAEEYAEATASFCTESGYITLVENLGGYSGDDGYYYYCIEDDSYQAGDYFCITLTNGKTVTYSYVPAKDGFYDEDGDELDFDYFEVDDQLDEPWECGGVYDICFVLYDYDELYVSASVMITENMYESIAFISETTPQLYEFVGGGWLQDADYIYYYDYSLESVIFADGDKFTVTLTDGSTIDYTYSAANGGFFDANGNDISYYELYETDDVIGGNATQYYDHFYRGGENSYSLMIDTVGLSLSLPVEIVDSPYSGAEVTFDKTITLQENIDGNALDCGTQDNDLFFCYSMYDVWEDQIVDGDKIEVTFEDGTVITFTYDEDNWCFCAEDGTGLAYSITDTQTETHWSVEDEDLFFTFWLDNYGISVDIPVTITENSYRNATVTANTASDITLTKDNSWTSKDSSGTSYDYYDVYEWSFSEGDTVVVETGEETITYTYQLIKSYYDDEDEDEYYTYYDFYNDEYGELIYYFVDNQAMVHWEEGGTYQVAFWLGSYGIYTTMSVYIGIDISEASITLSYTSKTYTGSTISPPTVTVKYDGKTLKKGTDYTLSYSSTSPKSAKTYYVYVTGIGKYGGSVKKSFKITAKSISGFTIKLSTTTYTYNGKVKKPSVTLYNGSKKISSSNYTVTYASGRKNCGRYKITVKGTGNYTGSVSKYMYIKPAKAKTPTLTSSTKKQLKVKYSKSSGGVTGYQIAYKVKGGSWKYTTTTSTSKTIKSLKSGKTYYVKVRAYKTINGKKYYGSWSKTKSKKVK